MMSDNILYKLGFLTGLLASILIFLAIGWIIKKKTNASFKDYDERQLLARGQAARYGFFVAILYMLIIGIIEPKGLDTSSLMYVGACLGLGVFGCTCIIRDAYFPVCSQSPAKIVLITSLLVIATVSNLALGLYPQNEVNLLNLLLGSMLAIVLLVLLGKLIYDKKKEDDHEA